MNRTKVLFRRLRTPVTIMMVPHGRSKPVRVRVSVLAMLTCFFLCLCGAAFLFNVSVRAIEYHRMKTQVASMSSAFQETEETRIYLKQAEREFHKIFDLKSKIDILESEEIATYSEDIAAYSGSFDMKALQTRLDESMKSVAEIREYIRAQKDIYRNTPTGWPLSGHITSGYGTRSHPVYDEERLHSGVDISVPYGTEVKVTADGIVTLAEYTSSGGIVVIVEHGHGFRTAYAHNSKALVTPHQEVKRGDVIALSGSTGISTGPHLHYEVWKNGRHVNPSEYLEKKG